jgi:hypothetical protein
VRERQRLKTVKGLCFFYPHGLSSLAGPNHLFPSFYYLSSFKGKFFAFDLSSLDLIFTQCPAHLPRVCKHYMEELTV